MTFTGDGHPLIIACNRAGLDALRATIPEAANYGEDDSGSEWGLIRVDGCPSAEAMGELAQAMRDRFPALCIVSRVADYVAKSGGRVLQ